MTTTTQQARTGTTGAVPPEGGAPGGEPPNPGGGDGAPDGGPPEGEPGGQGPVANFSLGPGLAGGPTIIDFSTREGGRLYGHATAKLSDDLFDCDPAGLRAFIELFANRSNQYGWHDIFDIPNDLANLLGETTDLIRHYGEVANTHVFAHAETYAHTHSRAAQDAAMSYYCLLNSLSPEAINKVTIWSNEYTTQGVPNGPCFYKVIIRESHIDSNATTSFIRTQLSSLDMYLPTIGYDVTKFNQKVKTLVEGLTARGETTTDLLENLFKGYKSALDKKFLQYIEQKESDYHEGGDIQPDRLMTLADNRYKILLQGGQWNAPSADEEKILALQAEVDHLKKKRPAKNNTKDSKKSGPSKKRENEPAWMTVPPKSGESSTKIVEGTEFIWCGFHGKWGKHHEAQCNAKAKAAGKSPKDNTPKMKLASALASIMVDEDDEESEDEEE